MSFNILLFLATFSLVTSLAKLIIETRVAEKCVEIENPEILCQAEKPRMIPNVRELEINEGERLKITCTGNPNHQPLFTYPGQFDLNIETSQVGPDVFTTHENFTLEAIFLRLNTVYGDIGWYGCYDGSVLDETPTKPNYDDPAASWVYVYIKSKERSFAPTASKEISGNVGGSVVIPCRPTSPDLHITLTKPGKEKYLFFFEKDITEEVKNADFDPKEGFELKNLSANDATTYECKVKQDNHHESVYYTLKVEKK